MNRPTLASMTVLLALSAAVRAEDWPEFRGPTGQGHVRQGTAPLEWGPSKNVVWKQTIPGKGWSSPVVVAGRIYLTSAVPVKDKDATVTTEQGLTVLCLDATTGKTLWEKEVFRQPASAPRIHTKNSHASPTPIVHEGRVYVHFGHMGTVCLDTEGKVLWKNSKLPYSPVHGNGGSPVLVDDRLIFSCDGSDNTFVVALNKDSGEVAWKTPRSVNAERKFSFHTPLVITVNDTKQVISAGSDAMCAYDPANGKEIWKVRYTGYSVIPKPVFGHGLVYVCTGYNSPILLAIKPTGKGDVTETHVAWKVTRNVPHMNSLLLDGNELYMIADRGTITCLEPKEQPRNNSNVYVTILLQNQPFAAAACSSYFLTAPKTGEVIWSDRFAGSNYSASPLLIDGKIYLQSEEGVGTVLKAGRTFQQLARNPLNERSLASFAVVDGALFVRTETRLYRFEAR